MTNIKIFSETGTWPIDYEGWCEYYKMLDRAYPETKLESPLHHDNRCTLCKSKRSQCDKSSSS